MSLRQCTCSSDEIDYECPMHKVQYGLKESPAVISLPPAKLYEGKTFAVKTSSEQPVYVVQHEQDCD